VDPVPSGEDPLRDRLLDAATRVFARRGYGGTKILDIVREAGLSTGAIYGRFSSKEALLREAVVSRSARSGASWEGFDRVAEIIARVARFDRSAPSDEDAVGLEAFIAARREPEIAAALAEAQRTARDRVQPLVDQAMVDGTVASDLDPEAVLYLVQTINLGLLLQRGAGLVGPDLARWDELISRVIESFGAHSHDAAPDRKHEGPERS
jgi:AcrR family transcriptional regulator